MDMLVQFLIQYHYNLYIYWAEKGISFFHLNPAECAFIFEMSCSISVCALKSEFTTLRVTDIFAALAVYTTLPSFCG